MVLLNHQIHNSKAAIRQAARPSDPASTISDMPDELLLEVIAYFRGSEGTSIDMSSLLALSKTNRQLHRLAVGEMYVNFDTYYCEPYLFLRTLLFNPQLAQLVKHASISDRNIIAPYIQYVPDAQDKRLVQEGLRLAGVSDWEPLAAECNKELAEILLIGAVIVHQTPNLISLFVNHRLEEPIFYSTLSAAWISLANHVSIGPSSDLMHSLEHLRTVTITRSFLPIRRISSVFRIPSLRKLRFDLLIVADQGDERGAETLQHLVPPRCNNIESIRFEECFIQPDMLEILIVSARNLKEFWYRLTLRRLDFELRRQVELTDMNLGRMLSHHRMTLETLIISNDSEDDVRSSFAMDLRKGLRNFELLKELHCPLNMLIGPSEATTSVLAEKLPPLLFGFGISISGYEEDVKLLGALEGLSNVYKEHTPLLEFIWIDVKARGPKLRYNWDNFAAAYDRTDDIQLNIEVEDEQGDGWSQDSDDESDSSDSSSEEEDGLEEEFSSDSD